MTTTQQIIDRAAAFGISATEWHKGEKLRLYVKTDRKDMSVYLECDGSPDDVFGAAFKVFCNTKQHPNWVKSQVAEYKSKYVGLFHAYILEMYKDDGSVWESDITDMIEKSVAFATSYN